MTMNHRRIAVLLISFALSLLLIGYLVSQIPAGSIIAVISSMDPWYVVLGFLLYFLSYILRTVRFQLLIPGNACFSDMLPVVSVHNLFNNLLPARTGELTYVYLLKKIHGKSLGEGMATLLTARIIDFIVIIAVFSVLMLLLNETGIPLEVLYISGLGLVILLAVLLLPIFFCRSLMERFSGFNVPTSFGRLYDRYLRHIVNDTFIALDSIRKSGNTLLIVLILLTILLWGVMYSINYVLALAMHIEIPFVLAVFASSFAILTTILPIQGIAGFGTLETGWAVGFMLVGLPKETAVSTGFGFHAALLLYTILLGSMGLIWIRKIQNRTKGDSTPGSGNGTD